MNVQRRVGDLRETVLITGGTGFVGQALIRRLLHDGRHHVRASVRSDSPDLPDGAEVVRTGAIDADTDWHEALEGVSIVVHTAAFTHAGTHLPADAKRALRAVNVDGTSNLANQAAASGVRRFVFLSSIKVHGEHSTYGRPFTADEPPYPESPYGVSKWEAERALIDNARQTGMEWVVVRPPLVYGPKGKGSFAAVTAAIGKGVPLPVGALRDNRRSLIALDNLVDVLVTCLDHPAAANETFLASDGEDLSTYELFFRIAKTLNRSPRFFSVPTRFLSSMLRLFGQSDIGDRLIGTLQADIHKTRQKLSWAPPLTVDQGLRRAIKSSSEENHRGPSAG